MRISVIGGSSVDDETYEEARELGRLLARNGHTVVCGGYGGVMEAVCRGAKEEDCRARTVGVLSGDDPAEANDYVDVPVATNMGHATRSSFSTVTLRSRWTARTALSPKSRTPSSLEGPSWG